MEFSRIRQIYPFKYIKSPQEEFCNYLGLVPTRSVNMSEELSDSQDDVLHLWKSVVMLEPCDTIENNVKVS